MKLTIGQIIAAGVACIRVYMFKIVHSKGFSARGYRFYFGHRVVLAINNKGYIDIGEKTWLSDDCILSVNKGRIILGFNNFFNRNVSITALGEITIGDNNLFGPNIVIVDHNHRYDVIETPINQQGFLCKPVHIGSDCWIGANVVICPGVTICDRVVIGAGSVVTKDLLVSGVYVGVPARLLKRKEKLSDTEKLW